MNAINDITAGLSPEFKKIQKKDDLKRVSSAKDLKAEASEKAVDKKQGDDVKISKTGKDLLQRDKEISGYVDELKQLSLLDQKTSGVIREKIAEGVYSKPEINDKIVDALLSLPMFREPGPDKVQEDAGNTGLDDQRLADIRKKIQGGGYDSEDVLEVVVDKLLKPGQLK